MGQCMAKKKETEIAGKYMENHSIIKKYNENSLNLNNSSVSQFEVIYQGYCNLKSNYLKNNKFFIQVFQNLIIISQKQSASVPLYYIPFSKHIYLTQVYKEDQGEVEKDFLERSALLQQKQQQQKASQAAQSSKNIKSQKEIPAPASTKKKNSVQIQQGEVNKQQKKTFLMIKLTNEDQYVNIKPLKNGQNENEKIKTMRIHLSKRLVQTNFYMCFKLVSVLGKGSFATVYLGLHRENKDKYAIKVFSKAKLGESRTGYVALENEIDIMRSFNNPNILRLYEVFETNNNIYLVMEIQKGGSLHERIVKKQSFSMEEVQQIMTQLLSALHHMHQQKIMHRDLKPDNILFQDDDTLNCLIADLGLAQKTDAPIYLYTKCGTFGYVAPEIWDAKDKYSKYTEKCDMYSLGIIFNIITTGKSPFQDKNTEKTKEKNKLGYINFKESFYEKLSPECFDLLKKLLIKDPTTRISAEDALKHDFFHKKDQVSIFQQKKTQQIKDLKLPADFKVIGDKQKSVKKKSSDEGTKDTQPTAAPSPNNGPLNTSAGGSPDTINLYQKDECGTEGDKDQIPTEQNQDKNKTKLPDENYPSSPFNTNQNSNNNNSSSPTREQAMYDKKIKIEGLRINTQLNQQQQQKIQKTEDSFQMGQTPLMKGRIDKNIQYDDSVRSLDASPCKTKKPLFNYDKQQSRFSRMAPNNNNKEFSKFCDFVQNEDSKNIAAPSGQNLPSPSQDMEGLEFSGTKKCINLQPAYKQQQQQQPIQEGQKQPSIENQ